MNDTCNVEMVKSKLENKFNKVYKELNELNDLLKSLSDNDVKKDQSECYAPRITTIDEFMNGVSVG